MDYILQSFPVTEAEYYKLDEMFGDLAHYAAWQLIRKNVKNNHTNDVEDVAQELRIALLEAGSYYKRQMYIESCLKAAKKHAKEEVHIVKAAELEQLWKDRTKHGANRQKFGGEQEKQLDTLVTECVPESARPSKRQALKIDKKFVTYCKTIAWNRQKNIGKKITKEKQIRQGLVSLSEFNYLARQPVGSGCAGESFKSLREYC